MGEGTLCRSVDFRYPREIRTEINGLTRGLLNNRDFKFFTICFLVFYKKTDCLKVLNQLSWVRD